MLIQLDIRNIALIDEVNIEPGRGLNVLTGETGAGKSIIIDSINAVLGERTPKDLIRTGKDKALVEAVFQAEVTRFADIYEEMGLEPEEDGTLILSREIYLSGKNICRVNGKMATVSLLKRFGERLVDMHGQYDNQSLLQVENHLQLLDSFGGERLQGLRRQYRQKLEEYRGVRSRLREISGDSGERERKIDLLRFQCEEIKKSKLRLGEEEDLNRQRNLMANAEKIAGALSAAHKLLFGDSAGGSSYDCINSALGEINAIVRLDEKYEGICRKLQDLSYQLEDVIEDIRKERDGIEYSPERLEEIEERLDLIYKLKRKYGSTAGEVLEYGRKAEARLQEMLMSGEIAAELEGKLRSLGSEAYSVALELNAERIKAAEILEGKIGGELDDLEMKRAKLMVDIKFDDSVGADGERRFMPDGLDKVEFLISPNVGEPLKPLARIASGGEMSRVMLAIKTILAEVDSIGTLIFDEIDIGISGKASQKVGEKLSYISRNHQVICVTHLAQIACMADQHFLIEKVSGDSNTETLVTRLTGERIRDEVARIIGGAATSETSRKYAGEMLNNAKRLKKA